MNTEPGYGAVAYRLISMIGFHDKVSLAKTTMTIVFVNLFYSTDLITLLINGYFKEFNVP